MKRYMGCPNDGMGCPVVPLDCRVRTSSLLAMTESKNTAYVQSGTAKRQPHYGLLSQVVEGLDLGVAEDAVVDAEVVEGAVEVIVGVGYRLA